MLVMKFGGTSLADRKRIETVAEIVRSQMEKRPVVVVSAHSGVTDQLIEAARQAVEKRIVSTSAIEERHRRLLSELELPEDLVERELLELYDLLRGIQLVRELTPRSLDYVMSFGERMSSKIVAAYFSKVGIPAKAVNSYDIGLITDDNFGRAKHLESCEKDLREALLSFQNVIPVVTGFLGKNREGEITTLGRSGSDYTASIIGSALEAEEVQIYTDVDGIMTADPRIVPAALSIETMSFAEASELAYYGAEVIHPSTMLPAIRKNIPIRVLNTYNPTHPGTLITADPPPSENPVKAIAYKRGITLINVVSTQMLQQYGFMSKIFDIFSRYRVVIDMIATSEVSVSMTTDQEENLKKVYEELSLFSDVTLEGKKAILCIVGEGLKQDLSVTPKVFSTLKEAEIPVTMVSQGATKINLSLLLEEENIYSAVRTLHRVLFETK